MVSLPSFALPPSVNALTINGISSDIVLSNAVLVLKYLVQSQLELSGIPTSPPSQMPLTIISHLARRIDDIQHPQAKACVLWLVGQYSAASMHESGTDLSGVVAWAPDVLRKLAKSFGKEVSLISSLLSRSMLTRFVYRPQL